MSTLKKLAAFVAIATTHYLVFMSAWGSAFAMGDAGQKAPWSLSVFLTAFGAPMMYLLEPFAKCFEPYHRWWGDDGNLIVGFAAANAIFWALVIVMTFAFWQRRCRLREEEPIQQPQQQRP